MVFHTALSVALLLGLAQAQPVKPNVDRAVSSLSNCGTVSSTRIVGGIEVEGEGKWPWLAGLSLLSREKFNPVCGGTLITTRHVLTAAHCFSDKSDPKYARLGENFYSFHLVDGNYPKDYLISSRVNPNYNANTKMNDLELLTLSEAVVFTNLVRPACLPTPAFSNINFANTIFSSVGWGLTKDNGTASEVVKFVELPNVDINKCVGIYSGADIILDPKLQFCAGNDRGDTCQGDSGGPLQYLNKEDNRYYVVGVVSFGMKCADPVYPGVYGRVDAYLPWINKIIGSA